MEIYGVFIGREIKFPGLSHSNSSLLYSLNTEEKCQFIERKIKFFARKNVQERS